MEGVEISDENVLISWINTFPDLPRSVQSFDDLFDGLIFSIIINQIDSKFPVVSLNDPFNITNEDSILLYNQINDYLKSGLVEGEPDASEEQVLNIDSIVYNHDREEVFYLTKVILGLAIQCPQKNVFLTRITQLPSEIQQVLTPIAEEVLSTMQYQEEFPDDYEYVDDDQLKTFEEMMGDDDMGYEEGDFETWGEPETPVMTTPPDEDVARYLEEKDNEIFSLKDEIMKLQEELADMDSERKALFTEQDMLMNQQEDLKKELDASSQKVTWLESRLTSLREELDESKSNEMAIHEDIKQTETENSELKKQLSTLTEKIALLQTQFEQQLQSVSFELEKEQARYQKLKKQYDMMEERTSRTAEVAASSDSYIIQNLTEENARLKVENQKQQATTRKLESERSDMAGKIAALEQVHQQQVQSIQQMTQRLEFLQSMVNTSEQAKEEVKPATSECEECERLREKIESNKKEYNRVLQELESQIQKYERDIEDKKTRMSKQYDYSKKTEEVMFTVISKLGETAMMEQYKQQMQTYRPKGWLGQMRVSLSKI